MNLIDHAAQVLAMSLYGEDGGLAGVAPDSARLRQAVHAVLSSLRDPDDDMVQAGAEIIRNVGEAETYEAHLSDAANTWRFMMDVLLSSK